MAMNIIRQSKENMKATEIYKLSKDPKIQKMSENIGRTVNVDSWIIYSELNAKGEEVVVLSIKDQDGTVLATNSKVFREQFEDIAEICGGDVDMIEIISGLSKNNREYVTCSYVGNK